MQGDGRLGLPSRYQTGVSIMARKATRRKTAGSSKSRSTKRQRQTRSNKRTAPARRASTRTPAKKRTATTRATRKKASVKGAKKLANPLSTKRSRGTPAEAATIRKAPGLERARKQLREVDENIPTPPSSLDLDRRPSAARSGRRELQETRREHTEASPDLTAGDVDADWEDAYAVGDEAPGGDNPTPDQDRVDDIGKALGIQYDDNEELKAADKISERDRHRWELDPASSDDYRDRD